MKNFLTCLIVIIIVVILLGLDFLITAGIVKILS